MSTVRKLRDLAIVAAGQGAPQGEENYCTNGIPFIKAGNLIELLNGKKERDIQNVSEEVAKQYRLKLYPAGTVLFAKSGMSCMKGYVYVLQSDCYVVSHLACIIPIETTGAYLKYYFEYHRPNSLIKDEAYPSISLSDIGNLDIRLETPVKQAAIVNNLDRINALIKCRKAQLHKIDDLVKSQFIEMFGDVVKNDKSWNCLPMTTVAPVSAYKGNIESTEGKYWLLNLDMVEAQTGDIISQVMVELNEVGASTVAFNQENVLYSKLRPYLNKVVNPKIAGYATSELVPLKPNKKYLNKVFFTALLRSDAFVHYIQEQVAGAKMPRVSMGVFRQFDVICPPIDLQNQFAAFVEQTDKSKFRIKQSLEKLEKCYKALLQKYFG